MSAYEALMPIGTTPDKFEVSRVQRTEAVIKIIQDLRLVIWKPMEKI